MDNQTVPVQPNSVYEVQGGDTLWKISRHQLNDSGIAAPTPHEIKLELGRILACNANTDSPVTASGDNARIYPGMHLVLPPLTIVNEAANSHLHASMNSETHGRAYNYFHRLHRIEHKLISFGREAIDSVNHWLLEVAANAFLLAKHEAQAHGVQIHINSAGRTYGQQSRLYHRLHGHSPVALPGTSNHETGLAIDVENWRQAKPYLLAHGFVHGDGNGPIKNDLWHFKFVGKKTEQA